MRACGATRDSVWEIGQAGAYQSVIYGLAPLAPAAYRDVITQGKWQ